MFRPIYMEIRHICGGMNTKNNSEGGGLTTPFFYAIKGSETNKGIKYIMTMTYFEVHPAFAVAFNEAVGNTVAAG